MYINIYLHLNENALLDINVFCQSLEYLLCLLYFTEQQKYTKMHAVNTCSDHLITSSSQQLNTLWSCVCIELCYLYLQLQNCAEKQNKTNKKSPLAFSAYLPQINVAACTSMQSPFCFQWLSESLVIFLLCDKGVYLLRTMQGLKRGCEIYSIICWGGSQKKNT